MRANLSWRAMDGVDFDDELPSVTFLGGDRCWRRDKNETNLIVGSGWVLMVFDSRRRLGVGPAGHTAVLLCLVLMFGGGDVGRVAR